MTAPDILERLSKAVRGTGVTVTFAGRGDGWYVTEYEKNGLIGLWPPYPTLSEAVEKYVAAKEAP